MYTYGSYYTSNDFDDNIFTSIFGPVFQVLFAGIGILLVVFLIIYVVLAIAQWQIFKKAGEEGWKAIIPVYNRSNFI